MSEPAVNPTDNNREVNAEIYVGRQPIYNANLDVEAYELLFRSGVQNAAGRIDNEQQATSSVIINSFMEIGLEKLVGDKKAFINFSRELLLDPISQSLPHQHIVIEVLESVEIDEHIIKAVGSLAKQGFTIALDDFVYDDRYLPLLAISRFIKLDVMALGLDACRAHVARLKRFGATLLAEKVETKEEFEACVKMGFELFQGYYFSRPQVVKGSRLAVNNVVVLNLLAKLFDTQVEFQEVEKMISQDAGLSFRLLRVINSAGFSLPRKIDSLKHAVTILGIKQLRTWISLLALSGVEGKPNELFKSSLIRARMCQSIGGQAAVADVDACFIAGLFSNLDALLDQPLEDLVSPLPLNNEIKSALLQGEGELGELLKTVVCYTDAQWQQVRDTQHGDADLTRHYIDAIAWAEDLLSKL